ncbi:hypothetical protein SAMN04488514_107192 [Kriegella aquimaris]|uniref:Uncharacterized protein n=1 Tax=Kriegella aquimaris TaxID=192904 RepID=A0A1G9SCG7_9FLAO|nr:hypothetical protein SAMN04488514_107192 [Kriegella aquimaris]
MLYLKKAFQSLERPMFTWSGAVCHVSLQIIDFQHSDCTYLSRIPLLTLNLQVTIEHIDNVLFTI